MTHGRASSALAIVLSAALGACAGQAGAGDDAPTDAGFPDGPPGCGVFLTFDPPAVLAGPDTEVRAIANVTGAPGVLTYTWQVRRNGVDVAFAPAQADQSAVAFAAPVAGPYDVMVAVDAPGTFCPTAQATVNVAVPGGNQTQVRLRVFPPPTIAAPPAEKLVLVTGGASFSLGTVAIDPGVVATGQVRTSTTGVAAYLRFIPLGGRDAYVEAFAGADGAFSARVQNQVHDVLIVPTVPGLAPTLVTGWTPGTSMLGVDPGAAITGVVRTPAGAALAGAKVQLTIAGVPSTLATTDETGAFTVRGWSPPAVPSVTVAVTPPAASGLPRLVATSSSFTLTTALQIRYDAGLALRDLGGITVRRQAVAQGGAQVTIVGALAAIGSVTAGAAVTANGEVRIATTASSSGVLPSTLAPAAPLAAVISVGAGDRAVTALDLSAGVPASLDAPPPITITTSVQTPALAGIANAVLELAPRGALAMVGAPTLRATSGAGGAVTATLAAGGHYELRAFDPVGRGAPVAVGDVTAAGVAAAYALRPALQVSGVLVLTGNPSPVGRAAVQILCAECSGAERTRPLAEGSSTTGGDFAIAVYDPGIQP